MCDKTWTGRTQDIVRLDGGPRHKDIELGGRRSVAVLLAALAVASSMPVRGRARGTPPLPALTTTIRVTPTLVRAIQTNGAPVEASGLLFDPHKRGHLWACAQGIGVVSSTNGGRAWSYAPQPRQTHAPCDLALAGRTLYRLDRAGALYASPDAGAHWALRSTPGALPASANGQSFAGALSVSGGALSLVEDGGLYASRDGGRHFVLAIGRPAASTDVVGAVRARGRWVAAVVTTIGGRVAFPNGLYTAADRGRRRDRSSRRPRRARHTGDVRQSRGSAMGRPGDGHDLHERPGRRPLPLGGRRLRRPAVWRSRTREVGRTPGPPPGSATAFLTAKQRSRLTWPRRSYGRGREKSICPWSTASAPVQPGRRWRSSSTSPCASAPLVCRAIGVRAGPGPARPRALSCPGPTPMLSAPRRVATPRAATARTGRGTDDPPVGSGVVDDD